MRAGTRRGGRTSWGGRLLSDTVSRSRAQTANFHANHVSHTKGARGGGLRDLTHQRVDHDANEALTIASFADRPPRERRGLDHRAYGSYRGDDRCCRRIPWW
jgi:hypothetical protein